jgi:transaldolase
MTNNPLSQLNALGQSVWYDNIRRGLLDNGEMKGMVDRQEIRGVTSNPAIFEKAIAGSQDYTEALRRLAPRALTAEQLYEELAVEDVQRTADLLQPVFEQSRGLDGYVSLEVSPAFAEDAAATAREAVRLWQRVKRPNLMIKIPATLACLPAIRDVLAEGVNVNVTLLFSVERYQMVMDKYLGALEARLAKGLPLNPVASVASFFVSRFDTLMDPKLDALAATQGEASRRLRGKVAIANAQLAYQAYLAVARGERYQKLKAKGAQMQRPLWASTGTKDPAYSDVYYIDSLVAKDSVNTIPPATLDAYRDHGKPQIRIEDGLDQANELPGALKAIGLSLDDAAVQLEREGVAAFRKSFDTMLKAIADRIAS